MAWPSTLEVYRQLNEGVAAALGGVHSADLVIRSFDFGRVEALQAAGDWGGADSLLAAAAADLEVAGAEGLLLATNTMHRCAPAIEAATTIPLLHIADATADAVRAAGVGRVGLLGTRYTMEADFYRGRLETHGLDVVVPDEAARTLVHDVIYDELVHGVVTDASRAAYREVMGELERRGAEGIIAGCTEVELLVGPGDTSVAWFPTAALHVEAALAWMLPV